MERRKKNPMIHADDYELLEVIGDGISITVRRARCIPFDEVAAVKILDLERNNDLSNTFHEAKMMLYNLWVVMPYMAGGSCLHIMKLGYPTGFEEVVIATLLREVLKGLEYLHQRGHIHRDVKELLTLTAEQVERRAIYDLNQPHQLSYPSQESIGKNKSSEKLVQVAFQDSCHPELSQLKYKARGGKRDRSSGRSDTPGTRSRRTKKEQNTVAPFAGQLSIPVASNQESSSCRRHRTKYSRPFCRTA